MTLNDLNLTNDAKFLVSTMYKSYVERRNDKQDKQRARYFGDIHEIHDGIMPEWSINDVFDTCRELREKGMLSALAASDTYIDIELTTDAVAIMESEFKDKINSVIDYAVKIKSLIPFV